VDENGKAILYPKHFWVRFAVFKINDQNANKQPYLHYACISGRVRVAVKNLVSITCESYLSILNILTSGTQKRRPFLLDFMCMYVCMYVRMYVYVL